MAFHWASALPLVGGLAGGFLGGQQQPQMSPEMQRLYRLYMQFFRDRQRFSKSIPGSLPTEQAGLAQAKGLAGQDQYNARQGLLAALSPGSPGAENAPDALGRFASSQTAQNMGIDQGFLQQFLQNRLDAPQQGLAGLQGAMGAAGTAQRPPPLEWGGLFGQIGQNLAYQRELERLRGPSTQVQQGTGGGGTPPFVPDPDFWMRGFPRAASGPNFISPSMGASNPFDWYNQGGGNFFG